MYRIGWQRVSTRGRGVSPRFSKVALRGPHGTRLRSLLHFPHNGDAIIHVRQVIRRENVARPEPRPSQFRSPVLAFSRGCDGLCRRRKIKFIANEEFGECVKWLGAAGLLTRHDKTFFFGVTFPTVGRPSLTASFPGLYIC